MKRYMYLAIAVLLAFILIEILRLISTRLSQTNKFRQIVINNRIILVLLTSLIISVILFAVFELRGANPDDHYKPAEVSDGKIVSGKFNK